MNDIIEHFKPGAIRMTSLNEGLAFPIEVAAGLFFCGVRRLFWV